MLVSKNDKNELMRRRAMEASLSHINLAGVHELQDGGEMLERNVLEDDDGVLCGVLLQQRLHNTANVPAIYRCKFI
jgi:hypothetical protein